MRKLLFVILLTLPTLLLAIPEKPNFVIIFIDDMGYGDIGPYGATKQRTPQLDRMAKEGMMLTSFYAAPVCSVSRAQLMTGCYGARVSVPGVYFPGQPNGLNPAEFTIAERLKECGYATACIGKWHLGDQPEFLPTRQGFDSYYGIPYSNDMIKQSTETGQRVVPLLRNEKIEALLTGEDQRDIVKKYTDEAIGFIKKNKDKPFFLYLPHTAVHTPIYPGKDFTGKSQNGRFGDWVEELDWSAGQVLQTLRDLKLDRKTLVVFTSDNGPWLTQGKDGGSAGPLRGGKGSTWEGGVREPTIAWWPGTVEPDSKCDAVAGTIDLLPTFVALAGSKVPADPVIDGCDISGLLLGKTKESPREAHYYFNGYTLKAVRQGPWKLAFAPQPERSGKKPDGGVATSENRLYNLDEEIGEQTNVAEKHPEDVTRLLALAKKMDEAIGGGEHPERRPAGHVDNPKPLYPMVLSNKKAGGKPIAPSKVKIGGTISSDQAPRIGNKPFTVKFKFETEQKNAVLVAQGGISWGYSVYLKDGHVVFAVRTARDSLTEICSPVPVSGSVTVQASLAAGGAMILSLDGKEVAAGKSDGIISSQPAEDFCVGFDNKMAVANYPECALLGGTLTDLEVITP